MYSEAQAWYAAQGVDTEKAIDTLLKFPISMHCWQGDDVVGFENGSEGLTGGIQATGNYPGRARNPEELMADMRKAFSLIAGKHRINLHASYAITAGEAPARDALKPEWFDPWIQFAIENGLGIDFNPTFFSHPMVKGGLTLSSPDENVRAYWIRHGISSRHISAYIAQKLGKPVLCNVWIPDGLKDIPADRMGPRLRLRDSLNQIFAERLPGVIDCVESKVFGIGLEAYTVGSGEFYTAYAASHPGVYCLMDSGHYHPTEYISDKISALLTAFQYLPLHVTRPVRWDSDHVVRLDDELCEIARELVRCDALDRVCFGLDYFDASINRVAAWVTGMRAAQKALLRALLEPHARMRDMQNDMRFTELMVLDEALNAAPWCEVWAECLRRDGKPADADWYAEVADYERRVQLTRA